MSVSLLTVSMLNWGVGMLFFFMGGEKQKSSPSKILEQAGTKANSKMDIHLIDNRFENWAQATL